MSQQQRRRTGRILLGLFALAMIMGTGPGILLVNPDASSPEPVASVANIPVLYLWALFWYAIQIIVLFIAYFNIWEQPDESVKLRS